MTNDITKVIENANNAYSAKTMQIHIKDANFKKLVNNFNIKNTAIQNSEFTQALKTEQINLAFILAQNFKSNIDILNTDPNDCEGGMLEYSLKLKQAKSFLEISNEVRKYFTSLIEKMTNM